MKRFNELDHYELLEITKDASAEAIAEAYKDAINTYGFDSIATYALFSDSERTEYLKRIEKAYITLADDEARAEYDKHLLQREDRKIRSEKAEPPKPRNRWSIINSALRSRVKKSMMSTVTAEVVKKILSRQKISGNDLKTIRELYGISFEDISTAARISPPILAAIENDSLDDMPFLKLDSGAILKNYLSAIAKILQASPRVIISGYLNNASIKKE